MFVYPIIRHYVLIKLFCSSLKAEDLRRSVSPENRKCSTHWVCSFCLWAAEEQRNTGHRRELHLLRLNSVRFTRRGRERTKLCLVLFGDDRKTSSPPAKQPKTSPDVSCLTRTHPALHPRSLHVLFLIFTLIFFFVCSVNNANVICFRLKVWWLVRMELKALVGGLFLSLLVLWNVSDCVQTHLDATEAGESSCQTNTLHTEKDLFRFSYLCIIVRDYWIFILLKITNLPNQDCLSLFVFIYLF